MVRTLLESNADVLAEDLQGRTAVHKAARHGHENVVRILLERIGKANETERWLATSRLRGAVDRADEDEVMSLLGMGADPNDNDDDAGTCIPIMHEAIVREDASVLQLLLANGADVNVRDRNSRTPLHWAASRGYNTGVRLLLEHGADIQAADVHGATPLHFAVKHGTASVVRQLLDNGAQLGAKDDDEQTVLLCVFHSRFHDYHYHMLRVHDHLGGEMDEEGEKIWRGHEEQEAKERLAVLDLLIEKGSDLDALLACTPTIVSLAIPSSNGGEMTALALVRRLLDKGADVAVQTDYDGSALYKATRYRLPGVVQLLLEHGADVNQRNMMYAGWFDCDGPDAYWDGWRGSYKDGVTALHEAARVGCLEIAHLLIDAGADVEAMDDDGITVLHEAATYTFSMQAFDLQPTGMVDLLLAHGADINAHYGPKKATVLHCVAAQGNVAMVCHLLQNGARSGATDADGKTALDLAAARGHEAMMFVLNQQNEA